MISHSTGRSGSMSRRVEDARVGPLLASLQPRCPGSKKTEAPLWPCTSGATVVWTLRPFSREENFRILVLLELRELAPMQAGPDSSPTVISLQGASVVMNFHV